MPLKTRRRRDASPGEPQTNDIVDPSVYFGRRDRGPDRKTLQLCKQAMRAISVALGADCRDDLLRDVYVDGVAPAPDASRLLVTVRPHTAAADPDLILATLRAKRGVPRAGVASAIVRKRAPELTFEVAASLEEFP